ncbi:MAG: hypothetical protein ACLFUX_10785 [Spirochaetaceae bacterium]
MQRKMVVLVLALLMATAVAGFGATWGVGASFGIDALGGLPNQAMLSVKVPQLPVLWGLGLQVGENEANLGLTADWWLYTTNLFSFVNLYVGPGLYAALPDPLELGGRVPIGINAYPVEVFEVFFEVAPAMVLVSDRSGITIPDFAVQGAFGFRFWFGS